MWNEWNAKVVGMLVSILFRITKLAGFSDILTSSAVTPFISAERVRGSNRNISERISYLIFKAALKSLWWPCLLQCEHTTSHTDGTSSSFPPMSDGSVVGESTSAFSWRVTQLGQVLSDMTDNQLFNQCHSCVHCLLDIRSSDCDRIPHKDYGCSKSEILPRWVFTDLFIDHVLFYQRDDSRFLVYHWRQSQCGVRPERWSWSKDVTGSNLVRANWFIS